MNRYSPIVTLLAVVLLGAGLLGVNVVSNPSETANEAPGETRGETGAPAGQAVVLRFRGLPRSRPSRHRCGMTTRRPLGRRSSRRRTPGGRRVTR